MPNGYFRFVTDTYYVVPHWPGLLAILAATVATPWIAARALGRRGVIWGVILALGLLAYSDFSWVLQPYATDDDFRKSVLVAISILFLIHAFVAVVSGMAAMRWLRRRGG